MMAARIPMPSLGPGLGPGHQTDGLAPEGHVVAGRVEGLGGVDDVLDRRRRQVARRLVEVHPHVADVAVLGDLDRALGAERAGHRSHVGQGRQRGGQLLGAGRVGGVGEAARRGDDHLGRTARERREVGVEDLLGRLGAAGQVVGEVAAERLGRHVDGHQADDPDHQDPPPVVVAPAGQPGQGALLGGPGRWGRVGGRLGASLGGGHSVPPLVRGAPGAWSGSLSVLPGWRRDRRAMVAIPAERRRGAYAAGAPLAQRWSTGSLIRRLGGSSPPGRTSRSGRHRRGGGPGSERPTRRQSPVDSSRRLAPAGQPALQPGGVRVHAVHDLELLPVLLGDAVEVGGERLGERGGDVPPSR